MINDSHFIDARRAGEVRLDSLPHRRNFNPPPSHYVSEEGVPFLLGGAVRDFTIDITECKRCTWDTSDGPLRKSWLFPGDLVVVRVGYRDLAAIVPSELDGANCASMMIVRRHARFCSQWLSYVFNSQVGRDQIEVVQYGTAQKQFNISHAVDFTFPFPPVEEQLLIANYLDRERATTERLIAKVQIAIERLQEYRTALITAAVTGKIDVKEAAALGRLSMPSRRCAPFLQRTRTTKRAVSVRTSRIALGCRDGSR